MKKAIRPKGYRDKESAGFNRRQGDWRKHTKAQVQKERARCGERPAGWFNEDSCRVTTARHAGLWTTRANCRATCMHQLSRVVRNERSKQRLARRADGSRTRAYGLAGTTTRLLEVGSENT